MIIDSHAHIFPFLGSPAGFRSVVDHMRVLQLYLVGHGQPVRRLRDHAVVEEPTLADLPALIEESRAAGMQVRFAGRVDDPVAAPGATGRSAYPRAAISDALTAPP